MSSRSRFAVSLAVVLIAFAILITPISEAQEQTGLMSQGGTADLITLVPRAMTYQGLLKDDLGNPIANETLNITFRIYNDPDAGYLRWDETIETTTDDGGYFDATLSDVNLPFNEDYWLELEIDSEILDPRQKMNMVGYAAVSDSADYASESGSLTLPYSETISSAYTAFSVTNSSGAAGHFDGDGYGLRAEASDGIAVWGEGSHALLPAILGTNNGHGMGVIGVSEGAGYGVFGQGDQGVGIYGLSSDGLAGHFDGDLFADGDVYATGDVGIGTSTPDAKLDVGDMIRIQDTNYPDFPTAGAGVEIAYRGYDNTGIIQAYDRDASQWGDLYLGDGNVGIGITDPTAKLDVSGNANISGYINVSGSAGVNGHLTVNDYMNTPFPRPAYNSGWFRLNSGTDTTLIHNVGGDPYDYFVDLSFKDNTSYGIHNLFHGGGENEGMYFRNLSSSSVIVWRFMYDDHADSARVRIWIIK